MLESHYMTEVAFIYRAVIFDFDNTLINYHRCEQEALRQALVKHAVIDGEEQSWQSFWDVYNPINWSYWERRHLLTRSELTHHTFRDALLGHLGDGSMAGELADTYWELFCSLCYFEPGAHEALVHTARSHRLGIITNGYGEAQRRRLDACGIAQLFDSLVISDEAGMRKPDPRIFELALADMGLTREEALFVGDSIADDYEGAKRAGIDFCFYNRDSSPLPQEVAPKYEIQRLTELMNLL